MGAGIGGNWSVDMGTANLFSLKRKGGRGNGEGGKEIQQVVSVFCQASPSNLSV